MDPKGKSKSYIVYYAKEMEKLAKSLVITEGQRFCLKKIEWNLFPDGTPNLHMDIDGIEGKNILLLCSFSSNEEKYLQVNIMYVLTRSFIKSLTLFVPFFPTATMERVNKEGQIASADVDCWWLSSLPKFNSSPVKIIIYDIHTLQNRFYFHDGALAKLVSAIPLFKEELKKCFSTEKIAIAFPDEGSFKRFGNMFEEYPIIICGKVRDGDKRIVKINDGDPKNCHVFIVDDLVQSGGTLIECKAKLLSAGASKVSAFVTHTVFPKESWKKFLKGGEGEGFDTFYATDTCPIVASKIDKQMPFKILSIQKNFISHL